MAKQSDQNYTITINHIRKALLIARFDRGCAGIQTEKSRRFDPYQQAH